MPARSRRIALLMLLVSLSLVILAAPASAGPVQWWERELAEAVTFGFQVTRGTSTQAATVPDHALTENLPNPVGPPTLPETDPNGPEAAGYPPNGCRWFALKAYGKNHMGYEVWTYHQRIDWCFANYELTHKRRARWATTPYGGWRFLGHTGNGTGGGIGSSSYSAYTSGAFEVCLYSRSPGGCIVYQENCPWLWMRVWWNGGREWDGEHNSGCHN